MDSTAPRLSPMAAGAGTLPGQVAARRGHTTDQCLSVRAEVDVARGPGVGDGLEVAGFAVQSTMPGNVEQERAGV